MSSTRVRVNQGIVRGCEERLPNGKSYLRFSGIPYARPPLNELRFCAPQKLFKFVDDEIDCTEERDACFHKSTLTRKYVGSEDCLNLNVYVPLQTDSSKKLTVMVYVHGGAMKYDSNSAKLYSPDYLLMEDVIVVTINFRLHILGFLSFPSMGISGNAGLKDQQMALEWIHENISNFNGDPDNICLFGESAGAASVHYQVLNEKSRRFFNSAICQSGTAFASSYFRGNTDKDVRIVARQLGCQTEDAGEVFKTLMNASVQDLYENAEKNPSPTEDKYRNRRWRLVIEKDSDDAFITESMIDLIINQKGRINVPMIFGTNDNDGMPKVAQNLKRFKELNDDMAQLIPRSIKLSAGESSLLTCEIKKFYFGDRDISEDTMSSLSTLFTDTHYLLEQTVANEFTARYQPQCKQYLYEFQFDGKLNIQKKLVRLEHLPGACHADDVFYLFGGEHVDKVKLESGSRENAVRTTMCKLWTNFAKYHDPTPDHDNPLSFKWTPVVTTTSSLKEIDLDYLVINDDMKMVRNLNKGRMDFWRKAFKAGNKDNHSSMSKL